MRPEISSDLVRRAIDKWKQENNIMVDIPTSKILEDILLRFLQGSGISIKVRDRKRDRLMRKFLNVKYRMESPKISSKLKLAPSAKGSILVNGKKYETSLMVSHSGLIKSMLPRHGNLLSMGEFNRVLAEYPEVIVVGEGYSRSLRIPPNIYALARLKGLDILSSSTDQAAKEFNRLVSQGKKVVGYFHVF